MTPSVPAVPLPENPIGRTSLALRVGDRAALFEALKLSLHKHIELDGLTTRDLDDPTIALLEAWASAVDIVSFYTERLGNEHYLRTATEARSLAALAQLVGCRPRGATAATGIVAFTVSAPADGVLTTTVPARTRLQSTPVPGEQPQTFETTSDVAVSSHWNHLGLQPKKASIPSAPPALSVPPTPPQPVPVPTPAQPVADIPDGAQRIRVRARSGDIQPGQRLLAIVETDEVKLLTVVATSLQGSNILELTLAEAAGDSPSVGDATSDLKGLLQPSGPAFNPPPDGLTGAIDDAELAATAIRDGFDVDEVLASIARQSTPGPVVMLMRQEAGIFGANAAEQPPPAWDSATKTWVPGSTSGWVDSSAIVNWETKLSEYAMFLDRAVTTPSSGIAVALSGTDCKAFSYLSTSIRSHAEFGVTGRVTVLNVGASVLTSFAIRDTTVLLSGRTFALLPDDDVVTGSELDLAGYAPGIPVGQTVVVKGEPESAPGTTVTELHQVTKVSHNLEQDGGTTVTIADKGLQTPLKRSTVVINANTAEVVQGESVLNEVLGSSDGSPWQTYRLARAPLTRVAAATPQGSAPSISVRVDGLLWSPIDSLALAGPSDRVYEVNDGADGHARIRFGDNNTGAIPSKGATNIVVAYQVGGGSGGLLAAGRINQLITRPYGVSGVTNPVKTSGAADAQTVEDLRATAPLIAKTLGRLVSLQDYADFALAFAGVAEAASRWAWNGSSHSVVVTVAGPNGATIDDGSPLQQALLSAMLEAGDPTITVNVIPHRPVGFTFAASIVVADGYDPKVVQPAAVAAARSTFAAAERALGVGVRVVDVLACLSGVLGIEAANVTSLYRLPGTATPGAPVADLTAAAGGVAADGMSQVGAEQLFIDPGPINIGLLA